MVDTPLSQGDPGQYYAAIGDKYRIAIFINGAPTTSLKMAFASLEIIESVVQSIPTMKMTFFVGDTYIEDNILADGDQIEVQVTDLTLEESVDSTEVMYFRLFNHKIAASGGFYGMVLNCIYDCPGYTQAAFASYDEAASNTFFDWGAANNLTSDGVTPGADVDDSNDSQVWLCPGTRGVIFLNQVCNHAWASPESCYVFTITRRSDLRFYDLSQRSQQDSTWTFQPMTVPIPEDKTVIPYQSVKFINNSGTLNSFFGYGRSSSVFDVVAGDFAIPFASSFLATTKYLMMDTDLQQTQRARKFAPRVGNTHDNYENALMQNVRYRSIYSVGVHVTTQFPQRVQLLDRVTLVSREISNDEYKTTYTGDYFVDGIITSMVGPVITQAFSLIREGVNPTDTTDLVGGPPDVNDLPDVVPNPGNTAIV